VLVLLEANTGPDASKALERLCSAKVDRGVGRCIYTLMLNHAGGIETACTVAKLGEDKFMVSVRNGGWLEVAHCMFMVDVRNGGWL
jgi:glycine cleavage system aminomethyltransferase T